MIANFKIFSFKKQEILKIIFRKLNFKNNSIQEVQETFYHCNNKHYFIGTKIYLNVLLRDQFNIHRYYHLLEVQIPI